MRLGELENMKVATESAFMSDEFLHEQRVRLNYQPVINFSRHDVFSLEALLHWPTLSESHISNETFIAEIERRPNLSLSVDSYVITMAANDWHRLQAEHGFKGRMSVNVSPSSLQSAAFLEHVKGLIMFGSEQGAPPIDADKLVLEITERQPWEHPARIWRHINELAALGVKFAADDFISGYANFNVIMNDQVSIVKLDKSVGARALAEKNVRIFVEQFATLTQSLNKEVVVEGIEEYEQAAWFSELGYNLFQGYFFAAPTDIEGIIRYLKAQRIYRR